MGARWVTTLACSTSPRAVASRLLHNESTADALPGELGVVRGEPGARGQKAKVLLGPEDFKRCWVEAGRHNALKERLDSAAWP